MTATERELLPTTSIRGRIQRFLVEHAALLAGPVLEVGSRIPDPAATWANNRWLRPDLEWEGIDAQPGPNVDLVADVESLPYQCHFGSAIASEVLEHVKHPWKALSEIHRALKPGGTLLVTVPFTFAIHAYPDDYWRISPSALELLLREAGFHDIETATSGYFVLHVNDHGEPGNMVMKSPIHVFGRATA